MPLRTEKLDNNSYHKKIFLSVDIFDAVSKAWMRLLIPPIAKLNWRQFCIYMLIFWKRLGMIECSFTLTSFTDVISKQLVSNMLTKSKKSWFIFPHHEANSLNLQYFLRCIKSLSCMIKAMVKLCRSVPFLCKFVQICQCLGLISSLIAVNTWKWSQS